MSYRDENDALRARNEALQEQLRAAERTIDALNQGRAATVQPSPTSPGARSEKTERGFWAVFWKLWDYWWVLPVLGIVGLLGYCGVVITKNTSHDRTFTRRATASFPVKAFHAEGVYIAPGSTCRFDADLEGNGTERRTRAFTITCGQLVWIVETWRGTECKIDEKRADGSSTYGIACRVPETSASKSSPSKPGLDVDAGRVVLHGGAPPSVIELTIEPRSLPVAGPALASP